MQLAQKLGAVIINADSQQVYSDLQILSARPTAEEMADIPHYLYGVLPAEEPCNAAMWLGMVEEVLPKIDKPKIFLGGTGMYMNALMNGIVEIPDIPAEIREKVREMGVEELEAEMGEIDEKLRGNRQRLARALEVKLATGKTIQEFHEQQPPHKYSADDFSILHLNVPREIVYDNINKRYIWMLENGALEEVEALMKKDLHPDNPILKAHGVPEIIKYLKGEMTFDEMVEKGQTNVRNYAKRQETWFKNQPLFANRVECYEKSVEEILNEII